MEVKVNIHTIQYNEYGEKNDIKVEATGTLYEKNDNTYVVYKEKENDVETTTSIKKLQILVYIYPIFIKNIIKHYSYNDNK